MYPTKIAFAQALRGGQYSQPLGLINGGPSAHLFNFSTRGPLGPWLSVVSPNGNNQPLRSLEVQPGTTTLDLRLRVPASAPNGDYRGLLIVEAPPPKGGKKSFVGIGSQIEVSAQVTGTQLLAGKLLDAYTYPKVEVGSPVTVFARVHDLGNVAITPQFRLVVKRGKTTVFSHTFTAGTVQPFSLGALHFDWPAHATQSQPLGSYEGHLLATFGTLDLGAKTVKFQLVPYGSLHRGGELLGLKLLNQPRAGYSAEVQAAVQSTGELQEATSFVGQLYRDGALVGGIKSLAPVLLQPGQSSVINVPVLVQKNGLYRVTGAANFAGAQSKPLTLTFRVGPEPFPLVYEIAIGAGAVVLAALIVALAFWWKRRRRPPTSSSLGSTHRPPRYTATHPLTLHVPPRTPVGTPAGRPHSRVRRGPS